MFVTDGIESAVKQARAAADDQDVHVHGGANLLGGGTHLKYRIAKG